MKIAKIVLFFVFIIGIKSFGQNFKTEQLTYARVRTAHNEKWEDLKQFIESKGYQSSNYKIFIRVFKKEEIVEVWISKPTVEKFTLLKTYAIASSSGELGPKRQQGDLQVPEGFYRIDRFNPTSNFYLSLGINYPNDSDKILGKNKLGGDIFIHGSDVTIGCVPITDDKIKELYILAIQARNGGQKNIYVHIFPFKMEEKALNLYKNDKNFDFWKQLKKGYDFFESNKKLPFVKIDSEGKYVIK